MFESDDFDQVLSQFDFPEVDSVKSKPKGINTVSLSVPEKQDTAISQQTTITLNGFKDIFPESKNTCSDNNEEINIQNNNSRKQDNFISPKHFKRKLINSHFDHQSKRKFPGPAGILTGVLEESKDESVCEIELLSQDIDFTQHNLQRYVFESPIWKRLLSDSQIWELRDIDTIKTIKHQALSGHLRRRKAQTVTAFVEAVDRSVTDPLIILRDETGSIKCTLHRDAWFKFSSYIVSEYCALILHRPTVLTTGGAFKKHYLNITLSNILAIYSSAVIEEKILPDAYEIVCEEDFTVIKTGKPTDDLVNVEQTNGAEEFDGLDSFFSDELF